MASEERHRSSSTTELLHRTEALDQPQLSFSWRFFHSSLCILGGVMFLLGSAQYFPSKQKEARGSAMFVLGASCFFIADSMDLYLSYSTAVVDREIKGSSSNKDFHRNSQDFSLLSILTLPLVCEEVMNAFMGTIGSLCYLLGCILFIPELLQQVTGDVLFIPGSIVLIISQGWKVLRAGRTPPSQDNEVTISTPLNSTRTRFSVSNMCAGDIPLLCADMSLGLGAVAFLIGSIMFLPQYDTSDSITTGAVYAFLAGSVLFISTGLCVFYKYFCAASGSSRESSPSSGYSSVCSDCSMQQQRQGRQSKSSLAATVV